MKASYILRLDDACPTMNRDMWDRIEELLDRLSIRPIVGVIPENADMSLNCSAADSTFWDRVRTWEKKGWSIALHGFTHARHATPRDAEALVPIHSETEFAGVPLEQQ